MRRVLMTFTVVPMLSIAAIATANAVEPDIVTEIESSFTAWDRDKDGVLSFDEIEVACTDPTVRGRTAAAAATLRNWGKLRGLTLAKYKEALAPAGTDGKRNAFRASYEAALKKLDEMDRRVFPDGLPKGPQLAQGKLGDCFLLAGVGTMAQVRPERLKKLVEELPDGKTAVNFGNGHRVELPAPTDAEVLIGSTTRGDGVWSLVFEKAIGERYRLRQKGDKYATPFAIIGVGGTPNVPLEMLTGNRIVREGCEMFQKPGVLDDAGKAKRLDAIRDALESAFKKNRVVIGGTGPLKGIATVVPGLYYNHSYGVLAYNRDADVVTFWNPMSNGFKPKGEPGLANGYPTSYGRFDCPLKEAVMWFGSFSIETSEKAAPPKTE